VEFELRFLPTRGLVHRYHTESQALAFVRDIVRVAGHDRARQFSLDVLGAGGDTRTIAEGDALVERALADQSL
jgi:hypothetical protein